MYVKTIQRICVSSLFIFAPPHSFNQNTLATIDWCESNYTRSIFLAEYWNAFSASVVALFSLYLLRVAYAV